MNLDSHETAAAIDPSDCWEVLERAAHSRALKRAARLREFLLYVGAQSLREGRSDLHEQEIGETVFGRAASYDTSQDNIVRVSATELRKRVDAYFASEGKDEPIVFEIPRGSYMPSFRWRANRTLPAPSTLAAENSTTIAEPKAPATRPHARRYVLAMVSAIALILAVCCGLLWRQNRLLHRQVRDCHCTAAQH